MMLWWDIKLTDAEGTAILCKCVFAFPIYLVCLKPKPLTDCEIVPSIPASLTIQPSVLKTLANRLLTWGSSSITKAYKSFSTFEITTRNQNSTLFIRQPGRYWKSLGWSFYYLSNPEPKLSGKCPACGSNKCGKMPFLNLLIWLQMKVNQSFARFNCKFNSKCERHSIWNTQKRALFITSQTYLF